MCTRACEPWVVTPQVMNTAVGLADLKTVHYMVHYIVHYVHNLRYTQVMNTAVGLADLKTAFPDVGRSLQTLLNFAEADVESTFGLYMQALHSALHGALHSALHREHIRTLHAGTAHFTW